MLSLRCRKRFISSNRLIVITSLTLGTLNLLFQYILVPGNLMMDMYMPIARNVSIVLVVTFAGYVGFTCEEYRLV